MGGCWPWGGPINSKGHGYYWDGETTVMAHRVNWEMKHGPVPEGRELHHTCLNPSCVNPDHLSPLTPAEHRREHRRVRGRHYNSRLSDSDRSSIRMVWSELRPRQRELAGVYGVEQSLIARAIKPQRRRGRLQP